MYRFYMYLQWEGGYHTPLPSDFNSFPYPRGRGMVIFFSNKMTAKDVLTITQILYPMNLGVLVLHHENMPVVEG